MAVVTITLDDDGNMFVDATTDGDDMELTEALGIIELAKDVLIRGVYE